MCVTNNKEEKMNNINPIYLGLANGLTVKKEDKQEIVKNPEKSDVQPESKSAVNSNEVLGFLAAQNADLVPAKAKRTVDVSKYVTPEQASRIAGSMKDFEKDFTEISAAAISEFPDLTEEAADGIAITYINSTLA